MPGFPWSEVGHHWQLLHKGIKQNIQIQPKFLTISRARPGCEIPDGETALSYKLLLYPDFHSIHCFTSGGRGQLAMVSRSQNMTKRQFSGYGSTNWGAWDLGPHSLPRSLQGSLRKALLHWKIPCSKSQEVVTFSKRKLWQTYHCIIKCIKMRADRGYICFESGSPSYIQQTSTTLNFSLPRLKSRFLHPAKKDRSPFPFVKILVCAQCHAVWECVWHSLPLCSWMERDHKWLILQHAGICQYVLFFLERLLSGLNNKWLQSAFLIEMRININTIICWWL